MDTLSPSPISFDGTLGALYISTGVGAVYVEKRLLQTSTHHPHLQTIRHSLPAIVPLPHLEANKGRWVVVEVLRSIPFLLETVQQTLMFASMYKFLITGYQNILALLDSGAGSGQVVLYVSSIFEIHIIFFTSLFFCWRIWQFSGMMLGRGYRIGLLGFVSSLAMAVYGSQMFLVRSEFGTGNIVTAVDSNIELGWKLSTCLSIALDVIITIAMTYSLYRARSGHRRTDNVIRFLVLLTVNTTLTTTILTVAVYITFKYLPNTFINIALTLLIAKTFVNSFFAVLNSRELIQDKLGEEATVQTPSGMARESTISRMVESKPAFAPFRASLFDSSPRIDLESFELAQSKNSSDFELETRRRVGGV